MNGRMSKRVRIAFFVLVLALAFAAVCLRARGLIQAQFTRTEAAWQVFLVESQRRENLAASLLTLIERDSPASGELKEHLSLAVQEVRAALPAVGTQLSLVSESGFHEYARAQTDLAQALSPLLNPQTEKLDPRLLAREDFKIFCAQLTGVTGRVGNAQALYRVESGKFDAELRGPAGMVGGFLMKHSEAPTFR